MRTHLQSPSIVHTRPVAQSSTTFDPRVTRSRTRLSEPGYVDPDDNVPECPQGLGRLLLPRDLFTRFIGVGASSFGKSIAKAPNREHLHAIHGMPPRTPLLQSVGAAQSRITTARLKPLLSLAVPYSMPQTCPNSTSRTEPGERPRPSPAATPATTTSARHRYNKADQSFGSSVGESARLAKREVAGSSPARSLEGPRLMPEAPLACSGRLVGEGAYVEEDPSPYQGR
jgi:hypothetical protein